MNYVPSKIRTIVEFRDGLEAINPIDVYPNEDGDYKLPDEFYTDRPGSAENVLVRLADPVAAQYTAYPRYVEANDDDCLLPNNVIAFARSELMDDAM